MSDNLEKRIGSTLPTDSNDVVGRGDRAITQRPEKAQFPGTNDVEEVQNSDLAQFGRQFGASSLPAISELSLAKPTDAKAPNSISRRASELAGKLVAMCDIRPVLSSQYLVKGWLDRGTLSVVYGKSNVGKTFFALDIAFHVAAAADWHGSKVHSKKETAGPVVYLACEGGQSLNNRVEAIRKHNRPLASQAEPNFLLLPTMLDLCGSDDAAALIEMINVRCSRPSLIIIDTLAMAFGSGDENTAKDMGLFVANCIRLRTVTGAHVMAIHHSGKDTSKGARGSGSLRAAADSEIELTRSGAVIEATDRKQRDKEAGKVVAFRLNSIVLGSDEDGDPVTSATIEPTAPVKKVSRLKGQALLAKQAFDEAVADHGEVRPEEGIPDERLCVSVDKWRDYCDRRGLSNGDSESAARTAFQRAQRALQEKKILQIYEGFVWACADE